MFVEILLLYKNVSVYLIMYLFVLYHVFFFLTKGDILFFESFNVLFDFLILARIVLNISNRTLRFKLEATWKTKQLEGLFTGF